MKPRSAQAINALLPQTQCGECHYPGCLPYAEAIARHQATIDLCPPGGVPGLIAIAALVNENPAPMIAAMEQKAKPTLRAIIREAECIGCTKCIQACPVDAILGSGKSMHTVIADECTGCELCILPCPVDCIDLVPRIDNHDKKAQFKARYDARNARLTSNITQPPSPPTLDNKKAYIQAALERIKHKKLTK